MSDTISGKATLLPCPFCGGENIDPEGWASTETKGPACDDCGGSAGSALDTFEANIAAWNTRAITAALQGQEIREALQKARERCRRIRDESVHSAGLPEDYLRGFSAAANACDLFILDLINEIDAPLLEQAEAALSTDPAPEGEGE